MEFLFNFFVTLTYLTDFGECSGRFLSRSSGLSNSPVLQNQTSRDELSFPYLNVYYNFDPKDWSSIREQQSRLSNFRKRLSRLRRQVVDDMDRINQFMDIEKNLAINARGKLFQTALSKNVLPIKADKNEKNREPIRLYDNVTNDIPHLNYLYKMNQ